MNAFIGIDLGTSGVRACAIDAAGQVLAQASQPLPASYSPCPGCYEQQPDSWWKTTLLVLDELLSTPLPIEAISVDGTSGTLLLCSDLGEPITPALMYNDARAQAEAQALKPVAPVDAAVHSASSALAKLMWLVSHQETPGRRCLALSQADWIAGKLQGKFGLSDENNVLKLGYDVRRRCWPEWMDECGVDAGLLPKVLPVGKAYGPIDPLLARRWKLDKPQLIAGTTDSNAATLASGIRRPGEASTALGSTLVLKVLSTEPVFDPSHGVYSHRLGERWLVGGASNSGGSVLRHYFSDQQLSQLSERIDPNTPSGLDYYPLPGPGERFPVCDPQLQPRLQPRPNDPVRFLHGLLEGIAAIEKSGYRRLAQLGCPYPSRVVSSGGGARNPTWQTLRQRLLGCPVSRAAHSEAAYGSALIAAGLAGL